MTDTDAHIFLNLFIKSITYFSGLQYRLSVWSQLGLRDISATYTLYFWLYFYHRGKLIPLSYMT